MDEQPLIPSKRNPTPLPKRQLAIILFARLAEPIAYTQIFPYIAQMVEELHIASDKKKIGFYAGLIDGIFALSQVCTIWYWGRLSDRIGRKPVVLIGLSGVCIATLLYGLSTSLWQLMLSRILIGSLCGNVAVIQSMISDITDETNAGQALPLVSATYATGAIIGPLIGGLLSHPAERYPNVFGNLQLLRRKPFFLPCFISSMMAFLSIVSSILFLNETLPSIVKTKERVTNSGVEHGYGTTGADPVKPESQPPTARQLLSDPLVRWLVLASFVMASLGLGFNALFVLFAYTPIRLRGLDRQPAEIGLAMSALGVAGILITGFVYPRVQQRFDCRNVFVFCMSMWPIVYTLLPITGMIARTTLPSSNDDFPPPPLGGIWVYVISTLFLVRIGFLSFSAHLLIVRSAARDSNAVGALFGLTHSAFSLGEGVGPALVSSLFAISIDKMIIGGYLVWAIMVGLALAGVQVARILRGIQQPR
ncbi:hypothetical protein M407DRAFT_210146 [Tulasnella calospora MUT 4182]|uniref:Major facilitator superfamily (MFS) profile domain-containing protein n=1 Tax=Tulasnella calospora MUT 4182 TaxID=1051891 RepID=A0A0C3QZ94_9AGAM|nr:hypothetical protein M407DRAFT_210146 [Tulasnella calospora MUT 4182]